MPRLRQKEEKEKEEDEKEEEEEEGEEEEEEEEYSQVRRGVADKGVERMREGKGGRRRREKGGGGISAKLFLGWTGGDTGRLVSAVSGSGRGALWFPPLPSSSLLLPPPPSLLCYFSLSLGMRATLLVRSRSVCTPARNGERS